MADQPPREWSFVEDPIIDRAKVKPSRQMARFPAAGSGGAVGGETEAWAGIGVHPSPWPGYFQITLMNSQGREMATLEVHKKNLDRFNAAASKVEEGQGHTIKLHSMAQLTIDGRPKVVGSILLQPNPATRVGSLVILSKAYDDLWEGKVDLEAFTGAVTKLVDKMGAIADSPPRRSINTPPAPAAAMPDAWVRQQQKMSSVAPSAEAAVPSLSPGIMGSKPRLLMARPERPATEPLAPSIGPRLPPRMDAGGYSSKNQSGIHFSLNEVPAVIEGRRVAAIGLELRLDEWPPLVSIEYPSASGSKQHIVSFTAGDMEEMRRSVDDPSWSIKQGGGLTLGIKPSLRGVMYEEIRKAVLDYRPGLSFSPDKARPAMARVREGDLSSPEAVPSVQPRQMVM